MRNVWRYVAAVVMACALVLAIAACGGDDDDSDATNGTAAKGSLEGVELTLWHNSADPPAVLDLYKRFERETGAKLDLVAISADDFESGTLTKWASGDRPDILEYHPALNQLLALNPANTMHDLSNEEYIKKSGDLYETAGTVDGKTYAAILGFPQIFGVYYNKAVFDKAGIEIPESFDDLFAACQKIKADVPGVVPISESGGAGWTTQVLPIIYIGDSNVDNEYGTAVATNKASLEDPDGPFVEAMEAYKQLQDDGCFNEDIATRKSEVSIKAVIDGKAAMAAFHSPMYDVFVQQADDDAAKVDKAVGFFPLSKSSPTASYAPGPLGTYFVPKTGDSEREDAALAFVHWATGKGYPGYVRESGDFPVIEGGPEPTDVSPLKQTFKDAYDGESVPMWHSDVPGTAGWIEVIAKQIAGQIGPEGVAKQMQSAVEQAAKAANLEGW